MTIIANAFVYNHWHTLPLLTPDGAAAALPVLRIARNLLTPPGAYLRHDDDFCANAADAYGDPCLPAAPDACGWTLAGALECAATIGGRPGAIHSACAALRPCAEYMQAAGHSDYACIDNLANLSPDKSDVRAALDCAIAACELAAADAPEPAAPAPAAQMSIAPWRRPVAA